jgi:hypothetical protein
MSRIGVVLVLVGLVVAGLGLTGVIVLVPGVAMGSVMTVIGTVIAVIGRTVARSFERDLALVQDLASRGVRRTGIVKDVVPLSSPHGGAVLLPEGAQLVVQIELAPEGGSRRVVTCQLVENSEQARRRIGQEIVVVEHPEEPSMRAIEGYLPNGRRRAG